MEFKIDNKFVGDGHPVFIIAEAGVNHNGSLDIGKALIDVAADSGADAVKFQTFKASELNTKKAPKSSYHIETTGSDSRGSWYDLLKTQEMSYSMHEGLIEHCNKRDIIFMSTPYGHESVDILIKLRVPAIKIASTDTNNIPFLKYVAEKKLPIILSSAMCNMKEVIDAVNTIKEYDNNKIAMLQCTGNYPAQLEDSNLLVLKSYEEKLNCIIGLSDHTLENINPIAATAMGAKIYEKHFTLDKNMDGPDHRMSLSPNGLVELVKSIRLTELTLGKSEKRVLKSEEENRIKLRKSIVSTCNIRKGQKIEKKMVAIKRPGTGIEPKKIEKVIGKKATENIKVDTILSEDMIEYKKY